MNKRIFSMLFSALLATVLLYVTYNLSTNTLSIKKNFTQIKEISKKQFQTHNVYNKVKDFFKSSINNNNSPSLKRASMTRYVEDEYLFNNIKNIENVMKNERLELDKSIINNKNNHRDELTTPTSTKLEKHRFNKIEVLPKNTSKLLVKTIPTKKTNVLKNKQDSYEKPFIRVDYKYNNPSEDSISKLSTKELLALEQVTDPLVESSICDDKVFLLVLVISQPENSERRRLIRESWGYSYEHDVKLLKKTKKFQGAQFSSRNAFKMVFVMSQSTKGDVVMDLAHGEAQTYNDIVFGSSVENYRNLTMKTRLGLKWSYYDCSSVYTIKTDDDVFINPVPLVEWLKDKPTKNFYTGYCNFDSPVLRDKHSKWYVSYEDYKEEIYPGYCLGGGYLLSSDVVGAVLKLSYGRKLFPMEDLYVGLIVKEIKGVKVRDERHHFDLIYGGSKVGCKMNKLFLAHRVLGDNLLTHIANSRHALQTCNL